MSFSVSALYRSALALLISLVLLSLSPTAALAQVQLLGRGWLMPASSLTGAGSMTPDDRALSQWWTPLPYGAQAGTLRFSYSGFNAAETAGVVVLGARVSIVDWAGATLSTHTLTFGGSESTTLSPDSLRYTDALPVEVPMGARAVIRTLYSVDAATSGHPIVGHVWSTRQTPDGGVPPMGLSIGPNVTLDSPLMQGEINSHWAQIQHAYRFYSPGYAVGEALPGAGSTPLTILSAGNSHNIGMNDYNDLGPDDPWHLGGWQMRGFHDDVPYVVFGVGGPGSVISAQNPFFVEGAHLTNLMTWQYGHNELRSPDGQVSTVGDRILSQLARDAQTAAALGMRTSAATMWRFSEYPWNMRPVEEWAETERQRVYFNERLRSDYAAYGMDRPLDMDRWLGSDMFGYVPRQYSSEGFHLDSAGHQAVGNGIREEWFPIRVVASPTVQTGVAAPEPATAALFATGLLAAVSAAIRRRRRSV